MPSSRTRARDADRDALCTALDAAFAEGQLDGTEHRERTTAALRATTLGELRALAEDLQVRTPTPQRAASPTPQRTPRARRRAQWVGAVVSLLMIALGFVLGRATAPDAAPAGSGAQAGTAVTADSADVEAHVVRLEGLHTPAGFTRFVADVRARLGTTRVAGANVYPGYAVVTTPVPGEPRREQRYHYQGGLDGPEISGTRNADEPLVDLAAFDPAVVIPLVAGAPESLEVTDATSRYMIFDDDGKGPRVAVYASNEFHESGYLEARPDGSIISIRPYEPR